MRRHLASTQRLMHAIGARGFPTFVAQTGDRFHLLRHEPFYGDPKGFADMVTTLLAPEAAAGTFGRCDGDSCST